MVSNLRSVFHSVLWRSESLAAVFFLTATGLGCGGVDANQNVTSLVISTNALGISSAKTLTLTQGQPRQIFATAMYADGTAKNLTGNALWLSSDETCAGIGAGTGLIAAAPTVPQVCVTSVTASFGLLAATTTVTVTPGILQAINLTSSTETPSGGSTFTFTAMCTYGGPKVRKNPQDLRISPIPAASGLYANCLADMLISPFL